jgi:hypothetical protein
MTASHTGRRLQRGLWAGCAGTAAMTATSWLRRRAGARSGTPVDYDASHHVVDAASSVLRHTIGWTPVTRTQRMTVFVVVHWGYGSAVACVYPFLTARFARRAAATAVFYALCQSMAFTLFPALGGTDVPWRWPRRLVVSSLTQHAVYAATVDIAARALTADR